MGGRKTSKNYTLTRTLFNVLLQYMLSVAVVRVSTINLPSQKPRKTHSKCNIPRSINHKPTQAKKPRKAHSKCNIPRSINHKPTQAQNSAQYDTVRSIRTISTAREAHSNCNIPRSINHKPTQAQFEGNNQQPISLIFCRHCSFLLLFF